MLLALPRGLLADVIELALRRDGLVVARPIGIAWRFRCWDVAIVPVVFDQRVRARRFVVVAERASAVAFDALIAAVRGAPG